MHLQSSGKYKRWLKKHTNVTKESHNEIMKQDTCTLLVIVMPMCRIQYWENKCHKNKHTTFKKRKMFIVLNKRHSGKQFLYIWILEYGSSKFNTFFPLCYLCFSLFNMTVIKTLEDHFKPHLTSHASSE